MKAMLRTVDDGDDTYVVLVFWCPGCAAERAGGHGSGLHMLPVNGAQTKRPVWSFDGNLEAPTLNPSILTHGAGEWRCHSYLTAGVFNFLSDSSHDMAGQQVPMPDLPEWVVA